VGTVALLQTFRISGGRPFLQTRDGLSDSGVSSTNNAEVRISELLDLFYAGPTGYSQLGEFEPVLTVPSPYNALLDHHKHMTVTVESHYGEKVDVVVHRCAQDGDWYSREITLVTAGTGRTVQYGIVRLDTTTLQPEVWQMIKSQDVPLGRVLIDHKVLREVQLCGLWRVLCGPALAAMLHVEVGQTVWGRTALIYCNGEPAIKLLEILTPTGEPV
jgi:hypothetical protein